MKTQIDQQQIMQNVQKAIGVVVFVSVIQLILIVFSFGSRQVYEAISDEYHQESMELLSQISVEMAVIRFEILMYEKSPDNARDLTSQRDLIRSVYIVSRLNEQLQHIENLPNYQQFTEMSNSLNTELQKLSTILDINASQESITAIINDQNIAFIKLKVEQLRLLHHQMNNLLLQQIEDSDKRNIFMIILVAIAMLTISIYIIRRSVKIIKNGLSIQQSYQAQLAEEKSSLYKKEAENREILSSVIEGIVTIDETGSILTFNHAAEEMFGHSKQDVIGKSVNILMPKSDADKHDHYLQNYRDSGAKKIIGRAREVTGLSQQRGEFPMRICISELPSQKGEVKRFIGSLQDLTQIKSQEEQIRRTQKMDALGKLTGGIAHDYNNMLAVISGYANLLAEQLQEEHHKKYAIEIAKAGERGAKLTRRLLSFSKRTATTNELCNLTHILSQMSDMLEKTLTARIQLVYKLDQTLLLTRLNPGDLEDAVLNICINAMHAIEGNGHIEIHTSQLRLGYGDYVELRIIDNGCGMDEATCEKIFDPFFSTKGDKGTGLGLSQVYSFVERSRGSIEVESKIGTGTEVIMRFPVEHEARSDPNLDENSADEDLKLHGRVLVVDDERQIRDYLTIVLENVALNVRTAKNGNEALEILAKEQFDIVLSDIIMPEMDGIELAKEIRRLYPEVKIQLATGFANDVELNKLEDSIAASIIIKPYKSNTIINRMAELLV